MPSSGIRCIGHVLSSWERNEGLIRNKNKMKGRPGLTPVQFEDAVFEEGDAPQVRSDSPG
jgi:hypothetical protein